PRHAAAVAAGAESAPWPRRGLDAAGPDGGGGVQCLLQITGLHKPLLVRGVRPETGVAVGLELEPDGQLIRLAGIALLLAAHTFLGPQQVLDVMAELVRDHVRLGEVTGCMEPAPELPEESEIEVHLVIHGAVEGA